MRQGPLQGREASLQTHRAGHRVGGRGQEREKRVTRGNHVHQEQAAGHLKEDVSTRPSTLRATRHWAVGAPFGAPFRAPSFSRATSSQDPGGRGLVWHPDAPGSRSVSLSHFLNYSEPQCPQR